MNREHKNSNFYGLGCFVNLNAIEGRITSPGYPSRYKNDLNCQWNIQRISSNSTNVTFYLDDIDTEYGKDFLTITDALGAHLGNISGKASDTPIFTSALTNFVISFIKNNQNYDARFSLTFSPGNSLIHSNVFRTGDVLVSFGM